MWFVSPAPHRYAVLLTTSSEFWGRGGGAGQGWGQHRGSSITPCWRTTDSELLCNKKKIAWMVNEKKFQKVFLLNIFLCNAIFVILLSTFFALCLIKIEVVWYGCLFNEVHSITLPGIISTRVTLFSPLREMTEVARKDGCRGLISSPSRSRHSSQALKCVFSGFWWCWLVYFKEGFLQKVKKKKPSFWGVCFGGFADVHSYGDNMIHKKESLILWTFQSVTSLEWSS